MSKHIPIIVITGFLGSGKTTFLSKILKNEEMKRTAVMINEFGEIGLDHALVEHADEDILELQNGCICCTIRSDITKALLDFDNRRVKGDIKPFERVLIETTGLADPAPIIHTLMRSFDLNKIYKLNGIITLVDTVNGSDTLDHHQEAVKQAAMAERIILSKVDLADDEKQMELIERLRSINPSVPIINSLDSDALLSELSDLRTYEPDSKSDDVIKWLAIENFNDSNHHGHSHSHKNVNRHHDSIQAFSMTSKTPISYMSITFFFELLSSMAGSNLLRVKGIINVADENRPLVIHGVQHLFHPMRFLDDWPDDDMRTRIVFITQNIPRDAIENLFNCMTQRNKNKTEC